jgi:uncharacterized protein YndB with AHSA1/START domain
MRTTKVVESIDIDAPREEVFEIITSKVRRLQLSPLWGTTTVDDPTADFPQEGSRYHVKLVEGDEEYDTIVTAFVPNQKFAYRLTASRQTQTTWTCQDVARGTRLIYHEEFLIDESGDDEFVQSVRQVVTGWLKNIKRYAELRDGWTKRTARWGIDRFVLPLKIHQRRVIVMLLAWEAVGCISFLLLGLGWGLATLLGWM